MKQIQSIALYPRENVAYARRRETSVPVGPEWPTLEPGEVIEILDTQGWIWTAMVEGVIDLNPAPGVTFPNEGAKVSIQGEKRASPFPQVEDGAIQLSNMSGHAHVRGWQQGDIVTIHGEHYKVAKKPRVLNTSRVIYEVVPATHKQWESRPGRVRMGSGDAASRAVGSAVQTPTGEWLHVKKVVSSRYGSAEGEFFGRIYYGVGTHVTEKKAKALNEVHGPSLSQALTGAQGIRQTAPMPEGAKVLIPRNPTSLAANGERVAVVDGAVLHERCGDPDRIDGWYAYIMRIEDKALVARVQKFLKAQ